MQTGNLKKMNHTFPAHPGVLSSIPRTQIKAHTIYNLVLWDRMPSSNVQTKHPNTTNKQINLKSEENEP